MYGFRSIASPKVPSWVHSDRSLGTTAGLRPVQADMKRNRWPSTTSAACDAGGGGGAASRRRSCEGWARPLDEHDVLAPAVLPASRERIASRLRKDPLSWTHHATGSVPAACPYGWRNRPKAPQCKALLEGRHLRCALRCASSRRPRREQPRRRKRGPTTGRRVPITPEGMPAHPRPRRRTLQGSRHHDDNRWRASRPLTEDQQLETGVAGEPQRGAVRTVKFGPTPRRPTGQPTPVTQFRL